MLAKSFLLALFALSASGSVLPDAHHHHLGHHHAYSLRYVKRSKDGSPIVPRAFGSPPSAAANKPRRRQLGTTKARVCAASTSSDLLRKPKDTSTQVTVASSTTTEATTTSTKSLATTTSSAEETSTTPAVDPPAPTQDSPSGGGDMFSGEGTYYNTGLGACGHENTDDQMVAAISMHRYDSYPGWDGQNPNNNPICGKRIVVEYEGKSVSVVCVDRCPGCQNDDLDLSPAAFGAIADHGLGRIKIRWRFE